MNDTHRDEEKPALGTRSIRNPGFQNKLQKYTITTFLGTRTLAVSTKLQQLSIPFDRAFLHMNVRMVVSGPGSCYGI